MAMMIARPTAASAAAWVMMKMANICPASSWSELKYRAKATNSRFTPLSISSMLSKMPIALRRESTPYIPRANKMLPRTRKWRRPGMRKSTAPLILSRDHDGADEGHRQEQRSDLEGEHVAGEHEAAKRLGGRDGGQAVTHLPGRDDDHPHRDRADTNRHGHRTQPLARTDQPWHVDLTGGHEDGKDDQHHDRADVHHQLRHSQEVSPEQGVHERDAAEHGSQRQSRANQVLDARDHHVGRGDARGGAYPERERADERRERIVAN